VVETAAGTGGGMNTARDVCCELHIVVVRVMPHLGRTCTHAPRLAAPQLRMLLVQKTPPRRGRRLQSRISRVTYRAPVISSHSAVAQRCFSCSVRVRTPETLGSSD
jgi:hypothetical protein